jgi:hypothetical protein
MVVLTIFVYALMTPIGSLVGVLLTVRLIVYKDFIFSNSWEFRTRTWTIC